MTLRMLRGLALAGSLVFFTATTLAADLTLDEAIRRALESSPGLQAERAAVIASQRQASLDSLAPPYTVGGELENFAGTGDFSGIDQAEATLRLGRTFELGGKRDARRALGDARIAEQRHIELRRKLDVAAAVRGRFFDVVGQQSRLELAQVELDFSRRTRGAVAYRVQRGASPEADLQYSELAVVRAELELEDAEHELESARVALATLWGVETADFDRAAADVDELPAAPSFAALGSNLKASADAQQFTVEGATLAAEGRLAATAAKPDVHGTLGVRRLEAWDDQALVLSLSVPFGLGERSQLAVARNLAQRDGLAAQRRAAELDAYQQLFSRYEELRHIRARHDALRGRMIPAAKRALDLTQHGYDQARYSFLQVAQAQSVLQGLQRERIATAIDYQKLLGELERATAPAGELLQ